MIKHILTTLSVALLFGATSHAMELNAASAQDCSKQLDPRWELAKLSHLQKADSKNLVVTGFEETFSDPKLVAKLQQALLSSLGSVSLEQPDETSPKTVVKVDVDKLLALVNVVEEIHKEAIQRDLGRAHNENMIAFLGACLDVRQQDKARDIERMTANYVHSISVDLKEKTSKEAERLHVMSFNGYVVETPVKQNTRLCVGFDC